MSTTLVDDREAGLRVGYDATDWSAPILYEEYRNAVKDWIIKAISRDGQIIGAVYLNGDELHVSVLPEWRRRWLTKELLKQLFGGPRVTTKVTAGHDYMYEVLKRLGFKESDGGLLVKEN
jgi:GNAT superfamily N-acetyltransferase